MDEFPFKLVYDHFAKVFVDKKVRSGNLPPMIASVNAKEDKILGVSFLDHGTVHKFFRSANNKAILGSFLRESVSMIGKKSFCMVVIAESYYKEAKSKDEINDSISDDPDAIEGIMISIYRPTSVQFGFLPFGPDGAVVYQELKMCDGATGRLSLHPGDDDLPDGIIVH